MHGFLHDDFFLRTETARWLYHEVAAALPIYDYHGHLDPHALAGNQRFANLTELWLAGDHYKWRAMRAAGIDEDLISGPADPFDRFLAWAQVVPKTIRNPLYHWTHLELRRAFGIDLLLSNETAPEIWQETQSQLQSLDTHAWLHRFRVALVATTDDPLDDLSPHDQRPSGLTTRFVPTCRPDRIVNLKGGPADRDYLLALSGRFGGRLAKVADLRLCLARMLDAFAARGARSADHGIGRFPAVRASEAEADRILQRVLAAEELDESERHAWSGCMLDSLGREYARRGWILQLHVGATRNVNSRLMRRIGRDAGADGIGDEPQEEALRQFLDRLDHDDALPKTVLYNLNPRDNYLFAVLAGCFQRGPTPGKLQWGPAWWFLDQQDGISWQLDTLSRVGLLSGFIGMTSDSRSILSLCRHEYFRRVLCDAIGREVEAGEIPLDRSLLAETVRGVCFANAAAYFGYELDQSMRICCTS